MYRGCEQKLYEREGWQIRTWKDVQHHSLLGECKWKAREIPLHTYQNGYNLITNMFLTALKIPVSGKSTKELEPLNVAERNTKC